MDDGKSWRFDIDVLGRVGQLVSLGHLKSV